MKASYRKHKTGFYPVIIFNDKSRMTHRVNCYSIEMAKVLANEIIQDLEKRYPEYMEVYNNAID
jgi:hypothetical protein